MRIAVGVVVGVALAALATGGAWWLGESSAPIAPGIGWTSTDLERVEITEPTATGDLERVVFACAAGTLAVELTLWADGPVEILVEDVAVPGLDDAADDGRGIVRTGVDTRPPDSTTGYRPFEPAPLAASDGMLVVRRTWRVHDCAALPGGASADVVLVRYRALGIPHTAEVPLFVPADLTTGPFPEPEA